MIICMSCTKSWIKYLEVSLFSLLSNNKVRKVYLFLEICDFEFKDFFETKFNVQIIVINYNDYLHNFIYNNLDTVYSVATLVRLIYTKIIDEEKIIYLDVDTITLGDISYLWNLKLDNYYCAGVEDKYVYNFIDYFDLNDIPIKCINAGVMVMNLKKLKQDNFDDYLIDEINRFVYKFPDQDVINKICAGKILFISNDYNSSPSTGFSNNARIMHYSMPKFNWVKDHRYSELWYDMEKEYKKTLDNYLK